MIDYEKMSDEELKAALANEGFDEDEIKEILLSCQTKSNECIQKQKARVKNERPKKIKDFNNKHKKSIPNRGL